MRALKASLFISVNIPSTKSKLGVKQNEQLQFYSVPSSFVQSNNRNLSRSKLYSTFSSTTFSGELETDDSQENKFDWFDHWYPLMPVCDLDKRVPHAKTVMGLDVVIWWDQNESSWRVFDDACPHRLAPLSEGRIDQWGRLQCVYHGWCFGGSGDCKFIPQAPLDGPQVHTSKKACAEAYPSTVQHKVLWFWPKTGTLYEDVLPTKMPPFIPELDDPSYTNSMTSREMPFGYEMLIENLMDPAHVPYAHYKLVANPAAKNRVKNDREGGSPIDIKVHRLDIHGFSTSREGNSNGEFIAPCVYFSAFNLPPAKRNLAEPVSESSSSNGNNKGSTQVSKRRALVVFLCVPVGPGKSRVIYSFPRNFGVWIDRIIPRWVFHLKQNLVLDSDLYLLHLEERKIMDAGPSSWQKACFLPTKSDAQVLTFRRWLKTYSGGQINWEGKFNGSFPPIPPKEQLMDRYWSHVVNCSSCSVAYKALSALETMLPVISVGLIGMVAATKPSLISAPARTALVLVAVLCFTASRWLAHFIYKNFHFHDYNHGPV